MQLTLKVEAVIISFHGYLKRKKEKLLKEYFHLYTLS